MAVAKGIVVRQIKKEMLPQLFKKIREADEISFSVESETVDTNDIIADLAGPVPQICGSWNKVKRNGRYKILFEIYIKKEDQSEELRKEVFGKKGND